MDSPPLTVAGVEGVCALAKSPAVVDGDDAPALGGCEVAVLAGEAWAAGDDAGDAPPPAPSGAVCWDALALAAWGFARCTRLSPSSCSTRGRGSFMRCLRETLPTRVSEKWAKATTSISSMCESFAGCFLVALSGRFPDRVAERCALPLVWEVAPRFVVAHAPIYKLHSRFRCDRCRHWRLLVRRVSFRRRCP